MAARPNCKRRDDGMALPEDIIFDVLVRLPAKDLCRFRCVSRAWRALISHPSFVAAQRSHAGTLVTAVFSSRLQDELRVMDMHGNVLRVFEVKDMGMFEILAPTRLDLICIDRKGRGAMIVDPAARRAFTVGRSTRWMHSSFGRATPSGAYKVLRLYKTDDTTICEVGTITDGGPAEPTWRQRPPPDIPTSFYPEHKASINGVLYFMSGNRVAAFDLESEVWKETIQGPPLGLGAPLGLVRVQSNWRVALTELKGTLCMVHTIQYVVAVSGSYLPLCADVWRLIDYNKSAWVKAYTIWMPPGCEHIQVLDVLDDGTILLLNRSRSRHILQFFNPSTEALTDIMEMAEGFIGRMAFYTGSLLSS